MLLMKFKAWLRVVLMEDRRQRVLIRTQNHLSWAKQRVGARQSATQNKPAVKSIFNNYCQLTFIVLPSLVQSTQAYRPILTFQRFPLFNIISIELKYQRKSMPFFNPMHKARFNWIRWLFRCKTITLLSTFN